MSYLSTATAIVSSVFESRTASYSAHLRWLHRDGADQPCRLPSCRTSHALDKRVTPAASTTFAAVLSPSDPDQGPPQSEHDYSSDTMLRIEGVFRSRLG